MDESAPIQNRRHRRSNVLMKATLELPGDQLNVVLRNLSKDGALVQGDSLPAQGSQIVFHRDGLSVLSLVAWSHCGFAGLHFDEPLQPEEMLRHVPRPKDRAEAPIVRRPGFSCKPLTAAERQLIEQWVECSSTHGD
ncbi:MAG TPA: PilZ domain-containing protein [Sphingomicrobium sp.]|nr:PilZ domain-containing protein [Sphingomicrobium sp.]